MLCEFRFTHAGHTFTIAAKGAENLKPRELERVLERLAHSVFFSIVAVRQLEAETGEVRDPTPEELGGGLVRRGLFKQGYYPQQAEPSATEAG